MTDAAGWNVWAESDGATRKFTVIGGSEQEALARVRSVAKGVTPVSREPLGADQLAEIDAPSTGLIEWASIGQNRKVAPGGVPLKKKLPSAASGGG